MTEQRPNYTLSEQPAPDQPAAQPAPMIWLNKTKLLQMAELAFANQRRAKLDVFTANENLFTVKADYDTAKLAARANGLIVGKNEDERKDAQRAALQSEQAEIDQAETVCRSAEKDFARAAIDVDMVKTYLRIMELPDA